MVPNLNKYLIDVVKVKKPIAVRFYVPVIERIILSLAWKAISPPPMDNEMIDLGQTWVASKLNGVGRHHFCQRGEYVVNVFYGHRIPTGENRQIGFESPIKHFLLQN
jgi:hypothetical protein